VAYEYSAGTIKEGGRGDQREEREAMEGGGRGGDRVGYRVAGEERWGQDTRIVYLTEQVMLNDLSRFLAGRGREEEGEEDPFAGCAAVIIDEAQERNLKTDLLLGIIKNNISRWPGLKVIVACSSPSAELFSGFFSRASALEIHGWNFPTEITFSPLRREEEALDRVKDLVRQTKAGDILCFLPGQDEVSVRPAGGRGRREDRGRGREEGRGGKCKTKRGGRGRKEEEGGGRR
jgi:HrpA-like RNA helicase